MIWCQREPTLEEMLSDSIIQAVMAADGVDPRELEASLRRVAGTSGSVQNGRRWPPRTRAKSRHRPFPISI